jgi:hypothetical protein
VPGAREEACGEESRLEFLGHGATHTPSKKWTPPAPRERTLLLIRRGYVCKILGAVVACNLFFLTDREGGTVLAYLGWASPKSVNMCGYLKPRTTFIKPQRAATIPRRTSSRTGSCGTCRQV